MLQSPEPTQKVVPCLRRNETFQFKESDQVPTSPIANLLKDANNCTNALAMEPKLLDAGQKREVPSCDDPSHCHQ